MVLDQFPLDNSPDNSQSDNSKPHTISIQGNSKFYRWGEIVWGLVIDGQFWAKTALGKLSDWEDFRRVVQSHVCIWNFNSSLSLQLLTKQTAISSNTHSTNRCKTGKTKECLTKYFKNSRFLGLQLISPCPNTALPEHKCRKLFESGGGSECKSSVSWVQYLTNFEVIYSIQCHILATYHPQWWGEGQSKVSTPPIRVRGWSPSLPLYFLRLCWELQFKLRWLQSP